MTNTTPEGLAERLERIQRYVAMRKAKPLRQMDDTIHGIHFGTEWGAELRLSDLAALLQALRSSEEQRDRMRGALERSTEGWANAIELKIIAPQHVTAATILRDEGRQALSTSGEG
jgi:hypothetical protein